MDNPGGIVSMFRHLKAYEKTPCEIEHLWFYQATQTLNKYYFWFDSEKWSKLTRLERGATVLFLATNLYRWVALIHHIIMDWSNQSAGQRCDSLGLLGGALMSIGWTVHMWVMRDELSSLVRDVELLCLKLPRNTPRMRQWWDEMRDLYTFEGKLYLYFSLVAAFFWCFNIMGTMLFTGQMLCPSMDMIGVPVYSAHWWCQFVFQCYCANYSVSLISIQQFIYLDLMYGIGRLHQLHADGIKELYTARQIDQGLEFCRLRECVKTTLELRGITDRMNVFMRYTVFSVGYLSLFSIVVGLISTLLQVKYDGITGIEVVKCYCLPGYFFGTALLFTLMGEKYIGQTETLMEAWKLCNWAAAPLPAKKLIYMTMLLLQEPVCLDIKPFLVLNRELLSNILKAVYYLLNILKDQLL